MPSVKSAFDRLLVSKTVWTAISTVAGVGTAYATGDVDGKTAAATAVASLATIFMRLAMAKIETKLDQLSK